MGIKKTIIALLLAVMIALTPLLPLTASADNAASSVDSEFDIITPGLRIGVESGTVQESLVSELCPEAEIVYMEKFNGYNAVAQGKLDCYVYDKKQMEIAVANGQTGVRVLEKPLGESNDIALGISDVSEIPELPEQVNAFIASLREDGTLDEMYERWVAQQDLTMPEIALPQAPEYVCVVLDLFSRMVLSYGISDTIDTTMVIKTFLSAFSKRNRPTELMFHSDQGTQYTSYVFREMLRDFRVKQSFSKPGVPYDNAVCESFFHTLKTEAIYHHLYETPEDLSTTLDAYISFYNERRPHRALNMLTPAEKELIFTTEQK